MLIPRTLRDVLIRGRATYTPPVSSGRVDPVGRASDVARAAADMRVTLAKERLRDLLAVPVGQLAVAIAALPTNDRHLRLGDTNALLMDTAVNAATRADVQRLHDELLRAVASESA